LRIGIAGGGTDVSPYCDLYGGVVLNAAISLYAYATIEPIKENGIILVSIDQDSEQRFDNTNELLPDGKFNLHKGVINRMVKDYDLSRINFRLSTFVDTAPGSGLGTSSTLVVAIIGAFAEMLGLHLREYDLAHYAFEIERKDLQLAGGRQDHYAASFGGINFMEFNKEEKVVVNPLPVKEQHLLELENNMLLYYTSTSRDSGKIIEQQAKNVINGQQKSIEAMHQLKQQAQMMKEALLKGQLDEIGGILDFGFQQKKNMADGISNGLIEEIYETAKKSGATGGKISGAGGGGFMIFYCPGNSKYNVVKNLKKFGGEHRNYQFVKDGLTTWTI